MLDFIKQAMLAGIGALAITKEAIENATKKLVEEGKITAEDAENLANEMFKEAEKSGKQVQDKIKELVTSAVKSMNLVTKSEYEELKARVEALENLKLPNKRAQKLIPGPTQGGGQHIHGKVSPVFHTQTRARESDQYSQ